MKDLKDQLTGMNINQKIETKTADDNNVIRLPQDACFQGVNRLFVLIFDNTKSGNKKVENIFYLE